MDKDSSIKLKMNNPFIALKHKAFRYYWLTQSISLIGTWMQTIGQSWLVYNLTKSPFLLGLILAAQFTPALFLSLFAGAIVDKFEKKKIILCTQIFNMLITFILAVLVLTGNVQYWQVLILAILSGTSNALDMPTRQSIVIEMVGKEDLTNAIALNSSIFNLARIVGPMIAAYILPLAGAGICFIINGASFLPVIIVLFLIKIKNKNLDHNKNLSNIIEDIKEGIKYIYNNKMLTNTLVSSFIVSTFAMNFNVLLPVFSEKILNYGETGYSHLMAFMGIGSLAAAVFLALMSKNGPFKKFLKIFG